MDPRKEVEMIDAEIAQHRERIIFLRGAKEAFLKVINGENPTIAGTIKPSENEVTK